MPKGNRIAPKGSQGSQPVSTDPKSFSSSRRLPYALHRPNGTVPARGRPPVGWSAREAACTRHRGAYNAPNARRLPSTMGRLLEFPSPQAVASVAPPWDPGRKFGAMSRRRPATGTGTRPATGHRSGRFEQRGISLHKRAARVTWRPSRSGVPGQPGHAPHAAAAAATAQPQHAPDRTRGYRPNRDLRPAWG
jgi:hypothetical protein